jgi:hypothetical protein
MINQEYQYYLPIKLERLKARTPSPLPQTSQKWRGSIKTQLPLQTYKI